MPEGLWVQLIKIRYFVNVLNLILLISTRANNQGNRLVLTDFIQSLYGIIQISSIGRVEKPLRQHNDRHHENKIFCKSVANLWGGELSDPPSQLLDCPCVLSPLPLMLSIPLPQFFIFLFDDTYVNNIFYTKDMSISLEVSNPVTFTCSNIYPN